MVNEDLLRTSGSRGVALTGRWKLVTEEQIRDLAYSIWEEEGRPAGKDAEHYYRAKRMLEEREAASAAAPPLELPPPPTLKMVERPRGRTRSKNS
jgi:hypothetical protein